MQLFQKTPLKNMKRLLQTVHVQLYLIVRKTAVFFDT